MAPRRAHCVRKYFSYDYTEERNTCLICKVKLKGNHAGNLGKHLKIRHYDQYMEFTRLQRNEIQEPFEPSEEKIPIILSTYFIKQEREEDIDGEEMCTETEMEMNSSSILYPAEPQYTMTLQNPESEQIPIELTPEIIQNACMELITVNGWPVESIESSGFRKILDPLINALNVNSNKPKLQINSNSLKELIAKDIEVRGHQRVLSDSKEFHEVTKRDAQKQLEKEVDKLLDTVKQDDRKAGLQNEMGRFSSLFGRFLQEDGPSVAWDKIQKLPEDAVKDYFSLQPPTEDKIRSMLEKLVVVKLNGGLGTSMGCHGPKSVIPVRSDLTFLDLTVQQIEQLNKTYNAKVPLVLMNSFNTDEDTEKIIRKYVGFQVQIYTFNQSCFPRISRDSLLPVSKDFDVDKDIEAWYPPGHGDFYESFEQSGLLRKFIEEGREYCFLSNIDNLGATVDLNILNRLLGETNPDKQIEFVMEVTDKTRADVKGGTLIQYENKLRLLEIAQVPTEHVDDFKSVKTFKFFNTNNIWAKLDSIEKVLNEKRLNMEIIINHKTLENGLRVIQLETAVGSAMKCFERGIGINVPRSRFLPVKKTSDLLLVMSNLYSLKSGSLVMSPQRMFPTTPLVKLGENHFSKVKEFLGRFANIPDLIELDHLTVSGDVTFGRGVSLRGTVIIIANHGDRIDIPAGAILENKIVSGNMRILDH